MNAVRLVWFIIGFLVGNSLVAPVRGDDLSGRVKHVLDGDTFVVGIAGSEIRVRVADIDAPEIEGHCAYERALALKARDALAGMIDGQWVVLAVEPGRAEDRYGRMLARVIVLTPFGTSHGRVEVGRYMIERKLARPWTGRREPWC